MSRMDAGLPGALSPDQAAALVAPVATVRASVPTAVRGPRLEPSTPEPLDDRPLEVLEVALNEATATAQRLIERRLDLAAELEALDRKIEAARETLEPAATFELRQERTRLQDELAELDALVAKARGRQEAAQRTWQASFHRAQAAGLQTQLEAIAATARASDEAIDRAISAVLDLLDAREGLVAEAKAVADQLNSLPEAYWIGPRSWSGGVLQRPAAGSVLPPGVAFDRGRIPALGSGRPRRVLLGI